MGIKTQTALHSLDARWVDYVECTRQFYADHPDLLPLRQTIFKSFVERKLTLTQLDRLKFWASPFVKRQASMGDLSPVDVVLWIDNPREVLVEAILPIYHQLIAQGVNVGLITTPNVRPKLGDITPTVELRIPNHFQSSNKWRQAWVDLFAVMGEDLSPECIPAFVREGFYSDNATREIERIFKLLKPRLLVLPLELYIPGSTAVTTARQLSIPTLLLQHGAPIPYNAPLEADHMAVWGEVSQEQIAEYGIPLKKLIVLGSPRHDHFPKPIPNARAQFNQLLGLRELPLFVFFSNGNDLLRNSREACEGCAAWLNTAAEAFDGKMEFVVRLHPNENGELYTPYPKLHVMKNECDLNLTISAADICGALCSTTLVDTLLYHKPVLQFYADGWIDLADNWRRGLAQRVSSPTQLIDLLKTGDWSQLVEWQSAHIQDVFANYPHSTDVVAAYIQDQL